MDEYFLIQNDEYQLLKNELQISSPDIRKNNKQVGGFPIELATY